MSEQRHFRRDALRADLRWGAGLGLVFAGILTTAVVAVDVLSSGRSTSSVGLSIVAIGLLYFVGGLLGGLILGLCRRLVRTLGGTLITGVLVLLPFNAVLMLSIVHPWTITNVVGMTLIASVVAGPVWAGGMFALIRWQEKQR